jgi:hypothetical protein
VRGVVRIFEKGGKGEERRTIIHLLPSSSFLGGFLARMLSGLGFLPGGAGLLPRAAALPSGTVDPARSDGFLCVISDLSTFRRPAVTASPLLSSEKTAPMPPAAAGSAAFCTLILRTGGGPGGGGGGGGGPPAAGAGARAGAGGAGGAALTDLAASAAGTPLGFQGLPFGNHVLT